MPLKVAQMIQNSFTICNIPARANMWDLAISLDSKGYYHILSMNTEKSGILETGWIWIICLFITPAPIVLIKLSI